ncbi:MAG TPA: ABC transporter substrate-binding protein [Thermomicrobiales bacterium]|nr:ABC transporter substrate-binding protein [Thermomicrobiales bacterium]
MHSRNTASRPTRRSFLGGALVAGAGLIVPRSVFAQDATPSAVTEPIRTLTREEFVTQLEEELGYTEAATPGGTFIDSNVNDIQTIHPLIADDADSNAASGLLYDGLIGGDVRTGQPAPTGLADFWEIAPDGRTYTFHLNKDARWHDGVDITAEDVQFSFDALANPDLGSSYSSNFLDATESWQVIDEHTFEVVAKEPLVTFLYEMHSVVVPKHIWESVPIADWRTDGGATGQDPARVVGSGPWKFQEWRQGESISYVRNDDYYQKAPYLDSYVIRIWPDQTSVTNAFLNGEIDVAAVEPADVEVVEATEGLKVKVYPTRSFSYYMTNLDPEKTTLFGDRLVRQALFHGLDRESIVNDILLGYAEVARGTQPVISYAYAPDQITTVYNYDPEKAKALLVEAGWTDTDGDGIVDKDGAPFAFEMIYPSGTPSTDQMIAYMQDAWRAIGVEMTPRAMEFSALVEIVTGDHNFEVAMLGFGWDASFIQDAMFGCEQYEGGFNMVRYCNERVDELNNQAKRTFDEDARRELVVEATNIVNEDLPVGVMHFRKAISGYSDRLQNFEPSSWGVDITYVWIQQ